MESTPATKRRAKTNARTVKGENQTANRTKRFCAHPGCGKITTQRYCQEHQQDTYTQQARAYDYHRGSAAARGYDHQWHKFAKAYLARPENQFCALHISPKCNVMAQCVDHIRPLRGRYDHARFDLDNLQPACLACNTLKGSRTMRGTYRFGKDQKPEGR